MGLGSGIRDPGSEIRDPGSGIRDPGSEIRDPEKTYSRSRIQGSKSTQSWIPDPDPQHCIFSINSGTEHRAGGGGKSRTANSDRALVLGVGGVSENQSAVAETLFPDSGRDRDSDETIQISRNLGLEHVEFVCLLDSQLCLCDVTKQREKK